MSVKDIRKQARELSKMARQMEMMELALTNPQALQERLMKEQVTKMKNRARRHLSSQMSKMFKF